MNDILKDAGANDAQIDWTTDDLPALSWENEKRTCKLETELKDALVELAALKGLEEALKNWKAIDYLSAY